jgi:hypothetical protein
VNRADSAQKWFPSFVVARRLGIESSALGRLTGGCRVTAGDKSFDVGLSLRQGTDLCVPELACPAPEGVFPERLAGFSARALHAVHACMLSWQCVGKLLSSLT